MDCGSIFASTLMGFLLVNCSSAGDASESGPGEGTENPSLAGNQTGAGGISAGIGGNGVGGVALAGGAAGTPGRAGGGNSGGASGMGGVAGTGGVSSPMPDAGRMLPPKMVLACDRLAASPLGEWERIALDPVIGNVASVMVDPTRSGTVYIGTGAAKNSYGGPGVGMWKTTDCGATWNKLILGKNADLLSSGVQTTWAIDSSHPDTIYTNSLYGALGIYRTDNGGTDWTDITPKLPDAPTFIQVMSMDPTDSRHLVVTFHDNCKGSFAPMCMAESTDRGDSWQLFIGPGRGWQENGGPVALGATTWLYAGPVDGLFYTKDSGKTWEKVAERPDPWLYLADNGTSFLCAENGVLSSKDQHTWTLLANSPKCTSVISDGVNLYASYQNFFSGQPFYSAPLADPTRWTNMPSPKVSQGAINMGYDPDHHVVYASNNLGGLWRLRVK
jgi:hypothetical protein